MKEGKCTDRLTKAEVLNLVIKAPKIIPRAGEELEIAFCLVLYFFPMRFCKEIFVRLNIYAALTEYVVCRQSMYQECFVHFSDKAVPNTFGSYFGGKIGCSYNSLCCKYDINIQEDENFRTKIRERKS